MARIILIIIVIIIIIIIRFYAVVGHWLFKWIVAEI
jgi:hypothetical protein